jgi:hypothetical protein
LQLPLKFVTIGKLFREKKNCEKIRYGSFFKKERKKP